MGNCITIAPPHKLFPGQINGNNVFANRHRLRQSYPSHQPILICIPLQKKYAQFSIDKVIKEQVELLVPNDYNQPCEFHWEKVPLFESTINTSMSADQVKQLSFHQKSAWFYDKVEEKKLPFARYKPHPLLINRNDVLQCSIQQIERVNPYISLKIQFIGEKQTVDTGSLMKEWFTLCTKEIIEKPNFLCLCQSTRAAYNFTQPIAPESIRLCKLLGTLIGKALFERIPLQIPLSHTIVRQLCDQPIQLLDVFSSDSTLYHSYSKMLQNLRVTDMEVDFTTQVLTNFTVITVPLIPNGAKIPVTSLNKQLYIKKMIQLNYIRIPGPYIKEIKRALYKIIDVEWLRILHPHELEMMLCGREIINVNDWQNNVVYEECNAQSQLVKWFWNTLQRMNQKQLSNLLHFVTGTTTVPIMGFKHLGSNQRNARKFTLRKVEYQQKQPYIKSAVCFNKILVPQYPNEQLLKKHLTMISQNMNTYFGRE